MGVVYIGEIAATSPSVAEVMRCCFLRAGLGRSKEARAFVLGHPKAWLGTAYHRVLERFPYASRAGGDLETVLDALWDAAVAIQVVRAVGHPLDKRFGLPERWPGYHLAKAAVRLRALQQLGQARFTHDPGPASVASTRVVGQPPASPDLREDEFVALQGKLIGKPDVVRPGAGEIVDYKTGGVLEHDEEANADVVKPAYVRQLRIYGYLVRQALGSWPVRGVLLPVAGPGVEIELTPADCEGAAFEAVSLLNAYNAAVGAANAAALAAPSPQACKWCSFKLICDPFWAAADPSWSGQLEGAAIEGVVLAAPAAIHGGAAMSLNLGVGRGTEVRTEVHLGPLNPAVFPLVGGLAVGDRVRVVGLRVRRDGVLVPTLYTVIAQCDALPTLVLGTTAGNA